ncbi:DUF805 domain-containing protein [Staphylococcus simulans]|uniref:DUF805 domain-containing protein n=1 Tax=Staphylococcus simulans TaxID=1286 RepID=UPI00399BB18D
MQEQQKKSVGFVEAFILFWKRYFDFKGRSRRSEFWFMVLWTMIIQIPLNGLDALLGLNQNFDNISFGFTTVYEIASFIPWIALLSRRFHDTGNTMVVPIIYVAILFIERILSFVDLGENTLSLIIHSVITIGELVFTIYVIVVGVQKSQEGQNKYGPEPIGQRYRTA